LLEKPRKKGKKRRGYVYDIYSLPISWKDNRGFRQLLTLMEEQ